MTVQPYVFKRVHVYTHTQDTAASTWNVVFPYAGIPVVDVLALINGELTKIMPQSVTFPSVGHVTITFTEPYMGKARIVA